MAAIFHAVIDLALFCAGTDMSIMAVFGVLMQYSVLAENYKCMGI